MYPNLIQGIIALGALFFIVREVLLAIGILRQGGRIGPQQQQAILKRYRYYAIFTIFFWAEMLWRAWQYFFG